MFGQLGQPAISWLFLALLLLFAGVTSAQERALRIPFHSIKSYVLLDTTVDHRPAVLILDTGSPVSFTRDGKALELHRSGFRTAQLNSGASYYPPDTSFDGIVGEDVLRHFKSVRINFKDHVLELEQYVN